MLLALAFISFAALLVAWVWLPASKGLEPETVESSLINDMSATEAA